MQSLDVLFPFVQPETGVCPNSLVRNAIRRAAIEFCERTNAYSITAPLVMIDNQSTYDLTPPAQARLVLIQELWGANRELASKDFQQLQNILPNWQTAQGQPYYYNQKNPQQVTVYPQPTNQSVPEQLTIRCCYAPTFVATQIPDDLVNLYSEALAYKAKSILMIMSKQPWSDANLSAYYLEGFLKKVDEAKIQSLHERTKSSASVSPRRFGS